MAADEFGGGVHDDVGSVLDRTHEVWGAERIVDNQRNVVAVGHFGYGVDVEHFGVGVAESLGVEATGVGGDCSLKRLQVAEIDDSVPYALGVEGMGDEVEGTAVEIVGCHDMRAGQKDILQRVGYGGSARRYGKGCHTPFEGCHTAFEDVFGRVGQTAVDVARLLEREAVGGVLRTAEYVGCSLIYRYGASVGGGIGSFLSGMELYCLEAVFTICCHNR